MGDPGARQTPWFRRCGLVLLLGVQLALPALAATPAGTLIRNQASASFTDTDGRRVTVTSNLVETRIEQVAGFVLSEDNAQRAAPGAVVELPHRIVNTGNGDDTYALVATNPGGDNIDLADLAVYPDRNRDGRADGDVPITSTPTLVAGGSFDVVIRGTVPGGATDGSIANVQIVATSAFDGSFDQSNQDTVTVGAGAAIAVTKSISTRAAASPSGPWRVTLRYENRGDASAGDLALIDALPDGMSYVPDSGRWSASSATLTDADGSDMQSGGVAGIRYCAYDASCTGLPEATQDANADSSDQVTAIIDFLPPGSGGTVSFEVTIDADLPPDTLVNRAEFEYDVAIATVARELTNPASVEVLPARGVVANGSDATPIPFMAEPVEVISATAGSRVRFDNIVWNTGSDIDTFTIEVDDTGSTFPAGTLWRLLRADGATPLLDSNGDGLVDTGPLQPGAFARVVMELTLPADSAGNNDGAGFDIEKRARSVADPTIVDPVIDHLGEILQASVDLTNAAAAGESGALGEGAGPEAAPVSTVTLDAAGDARFDLHVTHMGSNPTRYTFIAGSDSNDAPLPDGWQARFEDPVTGEPLVSTEALASGESAHVVAVITPSADTPSATVSVYFSARSEDGVITDSKHDAVAIGASAGLQFTPDLAAQVEPGGSVVYAHRLEHVGNEGVTDIVFQTTESLPGWQTVLWADTSGDGALGPGDERITAPWMLAPGEERLVFAQIFAPADAPVAAENLTRITASYTAGTGTESVALADRTRVTTTNVAIVKQQARDDGCDGVPDTGAEFATTPIEVAPGNNCVIYRLSATNRGVEPSFNVAILDYTPPWTLYVPAASCSRSPCFLTVPNAGEEGVLSATIARLDPGKSYFLEFSVRVR